MKIRVGNKLDNLFGENKAPMKIFRRVFNDFLCFVSMVSPSLNTKMRYRYIFGKKINLKNPKTFIEKLNWLKLNYVIQEEKYKEYSDKYLVRGYVSDAGFSEILNPLINVYSNVKDINWDILPQKFAIKLNVGSGNNIICKDKSDLNKEDVELEIKSWFKDYNYLLYSEMQNNSNEKLILIEEYIESESNGLPIDYKFYCFNGKPLAILVMWGREEDINGVFMTPEWEFLSPAYKEAVPGFKYNYDKLPDEPNSLTEMLMVAEKLSKPFPFVRVDLYQGKKGPIFGELTFTMAGNMFSSETDPKKLNMASFINTSSKF